MPKQAPLSLLTSFRIVLSAISYIDLKTNLEGEGGWMLPIISLMKYADQDEAIVDCARAGVTAFLKLSAFRKEKNERHKIRLAIVRKEEESDYPATNAHHTASLWNMLDVTLTDVIAVLLASHPDTLKHRTFRRIKLGISDFEYLTRVQRMRKVVGELKKALRDASQQSHCGVAVYEEIFALLGVKDSSDCAQYRKQLTELKAIRNIVVHNMSFVDDQFTEQCPWIQAKPGSEYKVTSSQYKELSNAVSGYIASTYERLLERFPPKSVTATWLKALSGDNSG